LDAIVQHLISAFLPLLLLAVERSYYMRLIYIQCFSVYISFEYYNFMCATTAVQINSNGQATTIYT